MKKIYFSLLSLLAACTLLTAQNDTLLYNGFQTDFETLVFPNGDDTIWINLDEDGLADANSRPQEWYITTDWGQDSVPAGVDTNFVAGSSSWLQGFLDGNRNWLITPPVYISDDQARLYWKSAPYQGFRYMDGYSVYISTTSNDPSTGDFGDPIFQAAQMVPPLSDSAQAPLINQTVEDWNFSSGYIHADGFTLSEYFTGDLLNESIYTPLLEQHEFDLSAYAGQTIYVAFLHDSDDDNLVILDDILITGNAVTVGSADIQDDLELLAFPNPATSLLNVKYRIETSADVSLYVTDMQGKVVISYYQDANLPAGEQYNKIKVGDLANGQYNVVLKYKDIVRVQSFVKI